jgi:asparagine synthase (glutamine-hydrolysing)
MCGIAGILKRNSKQIALGHLVQMTNNVAHRGPDDMGLMISRTSKECLTYETGDPFDTNDMDWHLGLGHQRLSILDLSPSGHQPMVYANQYWTVYNGEIYNYLEIRAELEKLGHCFRSTSDTEVILAAYAEWGLDCFLRFRGMWGILIIDMNTNTAILCRDRMGIKPLYWWRTDDMVVIASEIKQLLPLPGFQAKFNAGIVEQYLQTGYENPESSFFEDVHPVPSGTWIRIPLDSLLPEIPVSYWNPETISISVNSSEDAGQLFKSALQEAVQINLRSDVPVGCALSGGLDSSSVAILIDEIKNRSAPVLSTFSSVFPGDPTDERQFIDDVLEHIRAHPNFVTPDPGTFWQDWRDFVWKHDEPTGSLSVYASYCVARLARQANVPVVLNGQGGDEILSGYWQTYFLYLRSLAKRGHFVDLTSHFVGALFGGGNPDLIQQTPIMLRRYRSRKQRQITLQLSDKKAANGSDVLAQIMALNGQERRVYEIRKMFLPRLLKWDDRNSMAFGIEGRYPLLDHKLIELCLSFAPKTLFHYGWTKWPLRVGLRQRLPETISKRRSKFGFEVPQDRWLVGPLKSSIEDWLTQDRPAWDHIDREIVRQLAEATWRTNGKRDELGQALFRILSFDYWLELFAVTS